MNRNLIPLLLLLVLFSCTAGNREAPPVQQAPAELTGEFTISGAYAIFPLLKVWADDFMEQHPGVSISLSRQGTGKGLEMLKEGNSNIAMISREMSPEEEAMGFAIFAVAKDAVVPIINTRNPVIGQVMEKGLSHKELQILFSMETKPGWGDLYMKDCRAPVSVYTRSDASGAAQIWANFLLLEVGDMKGIPLEGDDQMVRQVMQDTNAIGFCNMIYVWDSATTQIHDVLQVLPIDQNYNGRIDHREAIPRNINDMRRHIQLGKYPHSLCRYLYLVINPDNSNEALKAFLVYVMTEGQGLVEVSGYCRVPRFILECQVNKILKGK